MGNTVGKLTPCLCPAGATGDISMRHDIGLVFTNPIVADEGLGHSFCYVKPENNNNSNILTTTHYKRSSNQVCNNINNNNNNNNNNKMTMIKAISGASISANTSTALSTSLFLDSYSSTNEPASSFSSSPSFASVPLQPVPRNFINSGPLPTRGSGSGSGSLMGSGPIERGFLSGPIERGYSSGPIDGSYRASAKLEMIKAKYKFNKWGSIKGIKDSILSSFWGSGSSDKGKHYDYLKEGNSVHNQNESIGKNSGSVNLSGQMSFCDENCENLSLEYENVQWAQGKAGEDRVHMVVSEDHGWVFVGIYDGFNGPDAPDFLASNLYSNVHKELKEMLMWNNNSNEFVKSEFESESGSVSASNQSTISKDSSFARRFDEEVGNCGRRFSGLDCTCSWCVDLDDQEVCEIDDLKQKGKKFRTRNSSNYSRFDRQMLELDDKVREKLNQMGANWARKIKHSDVLKALSDALRKTEEAYLDIADKMVKENPELSLMGSCVLVMLMIGEDVYVMNVGDSRAVLGQKLGDSDIVDDISSVTSLQLTYDHNTYVKEEVQRIRKEHLDDPSAIVNDRVKGSLKVTRAFGAGFLKQPKWNDALLEMFRIDYIGNFPYLTCSPSLYHHKIGPKDKFLILSSDGLYQYFTNEEAVSAVEAFMASTPEGDPAQHLIEEVLFRASKKAGLDFYELLEIPQGERRRFHDDVSVIVISLEGKIWRYSV